MPVTYFLAEIIGLYLLIVGVTMLLYKQRWWRVINELCEPKGETLAYALGLVALAVGLLLVLLNNVWDMGLLPLVVTIVSWIILLKSVAVFVVSPGQLGRLVKSVRLESWWYVYVVIVLVIGAYLTYAGFAGM